MSVPTTVRGPVPGAPAAGAAGGRLPGLDGLRGVAALVVLVHHSLLLTPALMAVHDDPAAPRSALVQVASATPLHLLWEGEVAVQVFFVLSGFVLTAAATRPSHRWGPYYPQRLLRLYLPVWAAVVLAVALRLAVPAGDTAGLSPWLTYHGDVGRAGVLGDLLLVVGPAGSTISALWSLRWEVLFSLLLPLFVVAATRLRHWAPLVLGALAAIAWLGAATGPVDAPYALGAAYQLPLFALGCVLAAGRDRLAAVTARWGRGTWAGVLLAAVLLTTSYWLLDLAGARADVPTAVVALTRVLQAAGAGLLVVAALGPLARPLSHPAVRWLGTRSFSLYLVHEPVVVAVGYLTGWTSPAVLLLTVPVSLLLAEAFFRAVERPSHRLSRTVGARLGRGRHPVAAA
ncbi:acyltransferase [Cellulomonas sp. ACRRI]|uniref:acyltransferase family protein n=1 Tax=Cellulomonas sp. ACRRI TaxID=2918188 RepID=UPI001EF214D5|nr:acyltransferase [Cellulomonas sp. ACRRI]MCG7284901.1 acyltransferase [Cellulomonas sp. ACRRI]